MNTDSEYWIKNNFIPRMENETEINSMIELMVELRDHIRSQGCYFPPLTDILMNYRSVLKRQGILIEDAIFDRLYDEFSKHDNFESFPWFEEIKHKHKHKKEKKEVRVSSKTAVGFLKFCAGSLLCLIPAPVIQTAGVTLAVMGVNDMVDGQRELSDKNEAEERFDANRRMGMVLEN